MEQKEREMLKAQVADWQQQYNTTKDELTSRTAEHETGRSHISQLLDEKNTIETNSIQVFRFVLCILFGLIDISVRNIRRGNF